VAIEVSDPAEDRAGLTDTFASRRYFRKFEAITGHLARVAGVMEAEGKLNREEVKALTRYVAQLTFTFRALSMKYLMVGRETGRFFGSLMIDVRNSGFPASTELMTMANDAQQAAVHLANMPSEESLKDEMGVPSSASARCRPSCNLRCHNGSITRSCSRGICFGSRMIRNINGLATWARTGAGSCCTGPLTIRRPTCR